MSLLSLLTFVFSLILLDSAISFIIIKYLYDLSLKTIILASLSALLSLYIICILLYFVIKKTNFSNWVKYTYEEYKAKRNEEKAKQNEKRKEKLKTELEKLEKTE